MLKEHQSEQVPDVDKTPDGLSVGSFVGMGISLLVILGVIVTILALYTSPGNPFRSRQKRLLKYASRTVVPQEAFLESAIDIARPPPTYHIAPHPTVKDDVVPVNRSSLEGTTSSQWNACGASPTQVPWKDGPGPSSSHGGNIGDLEIGKGMDHGFRVASNPKGIYTSEESRIPLPSSESSDVKPKHPHQGEAERSPALDQERSSEEESTLSGSASLPDTSTMGPTLEIYKKRAVNSLMTEFKSLLSHGPHLGLKIRAGGREQRTEDHPRLSNSSSGGSSTASKRARGRNDCVKLDASSKRPKLDDLTSAGSRFACPFYKRNPKKHLRHRACAGPGWGEVRRVKEHLYRTHAIPIHCHRCGMILKSEKDLRNHQRQPEGCEIKLVDLPEGFDKAQEAELRRKKHGETEEERWYAMYKILFPDEDGDLVPSPYYSTSSSTDAEQQRADEIQQYERFQRRELLRVVRRLLQDAVSGMAGPLEDQLRAHFVAIIRQAQSEVFQAYRDSMKHKSSNLKEGCIENRADASSTDMAPSIHTELSPAAAHSRQVEAQTSTGSSSSIHTSSGYCDWVRSTGQSSRNCNDFSTSIDTLDHGNLYVDHTALQFMLDVENTPLWSADDGDHTPDNNQSQFLPSLFNMSTDPRQPRRLTMGDTCRDSSEIDSGLGSATSYLIDGQSVWGSQDTSESSAISTDGGIRDDFHHTRNGQATATSRPSGDESWRSPHLGSFMRLDY